MPSPGMMERHYAPKKNLYLVDLESGSIPRALDLSKIRSVTWIQFGKKSRPALPGSIRIHPILLSENAHEAAHRLFSALREADESDSDVILADLFPDRTGLGHAIRDRLRRAAAGHSPDSEKSPSGPAPSPELSPELSIDLHSHLFMKRGLGWIFRGGAECPADSRAFSKSWRTRFRAKTNPELLDASGIGIVVAALYAHPLFIGNLRNSIRRQIDDAEAFVARHPRWVIARSPADARGALSDGKKVMILAIEGAQGILESERDLDEFVTERGVRIVTLMHFIDDRFGGAAFLKGIGAWLTPTGMFRSLIGQIFGRARFEAGVRLNARGLQPGGLWLVGELARRGVWM
jgi:hypothetical protein